MTRISRGVAVLAVACVLAGCGGGGGDSPPPASSAPPPPPPASSPPEDATPDPFTFAEQPNAARGAATTSNPVTISGINVPVSISVSGGEYSIDGGAFASTARTVSNGASVSVRLTASLTPGGVVEATVTIGGTSATFRVATSTDVTPPTAAIVFPPPVARTSGNFVYVRGSAADDSGPLGAVRVNGFAATSTDGFATWTAAVPLPLPGANTLTVAAEDQAGNVANAVAEVTVRRGPRFGTPVSLAIDPLNNRAFVADGAADAIVAVNLGTGIRTWFANSGMPDYGRKYAAPTAVVNDEARSRLLLLDGFSETILGINWVTRERYVFSGAGTHGGANRFGGASDLVIDEAHDRVLVTRNSPEPGIVAVSILDGARTVLSDATMHNGATMFAQARALALDRARGRVLVTDASTNTIYGVSLTDGSRTVVSSNTFPDASEQFGSVLAIVVDETNDRALVPQFNGKVLAVDLDTGARTVFSAGASPQLIYDVADLAIDEDGGRVIVLDGYKRGLAAISLSDGAQSVVSANDFAGGGVALTQPTGMALDLPNARLLVADESSRAVVSVGLASAVGTVVVDGASGPAPFSAPQALVLDGANSRLFVLESGRAVPTFPPAIVAVDLGTGVRSVLSGPAQPNASLPLTTPMQMALDAAGARLLVTERDDRLVKAVDVQSGVRTVVSSDAVPDSTNPFATPLGIVVDAALDRALIANSEYSPASSVLAMNLATGLRSVVASNASGTLTGPVLLALDSARNRALVADELRQSLYAVDLTTGAIEEMTDPDDPDNPIDRPTALAYDPAKQVAYVVEGHFGAVVAVDVVTGRRVFLSH